MPLTGWHRKNGGRANRLFFSTYVEPEDLLRSGSEEGTGYSFARMQRTKGSEEGTGYSFARMQRTLPSMVVR